MSFNRYFVTSSYALLAMSFMMLVATGQLGLLMILIFAGSLAAGWLIDIGRISWSMPVEATKWLVLGYLPLALIVLQLLGLRQLVPVIIYFILLAAAVRLLRLKTNRDWLWLYIVSFCQVLMAAGMMLSTTFLLLLIFYLFAGISTFVSYEIRRSQQIFEASFSAQNLNAKPPQVEFLRDGEGPRQEPTTPRWRSLSYFSGGVLVLILALAVPIFLAMPRFARGFSRTGLLATETLSGFSDTVRLGEVAKVKLNPQVVMRVRVKFPAEAERTTLRWRGVTLDYYDGQAWRKESGIGQTPIRKFAESFRVDERLAPHGFTHQRFFVEPLNINAVFAAPRPIFVTGLAELRRDSGDGLWAEPHPYHKIDYDVYSDTSLPSDVELAADSLRGYPLEIRRKYLQLPLDHDLRINELAAEVTRGASTPFDQARAIEQYLRANYGYTLNLRHVEEGDPVADFLFNTHAGHCEYFASAMVLLARSRRIPTRIVNGFQMGEYNGSADVYTVRQSDAHSWVEVYFPSYGWIAFDPTPPAGLSVYEDDLMAWLRHYGEAMEMFWLEQVVGFDTHKQLSMAISLQRWLGSHQHTASLQWMEWASNLAQKIESWRLGHRQFDGKALDFKPSSGLIGQSLAVLPLSLLVFTGSLLAVLMIRKQRLSWQRNLGGDSSNLAIAFYQEMLRRLERAGYRREPSQTPAEFAAQVGIPGVDEITVLYQRSRFGHERLSRDEILRIQRALGDLKKLSAASRLSRLSRGAWRLARRQKSTDSMSGIDSGSGGRHE